MRSAERRGSSHSSAGWNGRGELGYWCDDGAAALSWVLTARGAVCGTSPVEVPCRLRPLPQDHLLRRFGHQLRRRPRDAGRVPRLAPARNGPTIEVHGAYREFWKRHSDPPATAEGGFNRRTSAPDAASGATSQPRPPPWRRSPLRRPASRPRQQPRRHRAKPTSLHRAPESGFRARCRRRRRWLLPQVAQFWEVPPWTGHRTPG